MESQDAGGYRWKPYRPSVLEQLSRDVRPDDHAHARMALDITLRPQHDDTKLLGSTLLIKAMDAEGETLLYHGPYRGRLVLDPVAYTRTSADLFIWAFHEESGTFLSWKSLKTWPIFVGKPLTIALYDGHRDDVEGWFSVSHGD
ncbi:uncharacterized protein SOCE26_004380 [Sorangium cellulosum]|uniref:Uncharacterized protein n=1 Tax=Sorangium cellulosum TaxID=56 RepID=A0A2L0EIE0_SORCE|nr:hypothetical protein [Sorangium cellulosum]AUX39056.1 uncharacterized protein SOCE26_004380 [Sorangium cellulosum]